MEKFNFTSEQTTQVEGLIFKGELVAAIQLVRSITGAALPQAKNIFDDWATRLRETSPEKFKIYHPEKVGKWASYKGYRVWLSTRDAEHYNVSFLCNTYYFPGPTDWMIDMHNAGAGEYFGKIRLDDPELQIQE